MRTRIPLMAGAVLAAGAVVPAALVPGLAQSRPPYLDPSLPAQARAADLLSRMTLEEKVGQMTQVNATRLMGSGEWDRGPINERWLETAFGEFAVGSVLSGGGAAPVPNTPEGWASFTNALQRANLERSRLKIPLVYGTDAVHGHNNVAGATIFPHNLGLAASFDPRLAEALAASTARAMRATGVRWNFAPVADLGRDPRWGRFYETFGEDPLLASSLVAASVRGLQGPSLSRGVAATVKHFLGYGQAPGGTDRADALIPARALRELHLPPFAAGLAAGAATIMANSGSVNGMPVHASRALLTGLLRDELGFRGVTVSDWEDILKLQTQHRVAASFPDAVERAINAGVDVYMVPNDVGGFSRALVALVRAGRVPLARVDEAVGRVLRLKFELGLFESPFVDASRADALVLNADRDFARRAAARSMTLLKNAGVLPVPRSVRSVLLTGPGADSVRDQMGGWTIGWQGVPDGPERPPATTVLAGLRAALPAGARLRYLPGTDLDAVRAAARAADLTVVVASEGPYAEGQGDSRTIALAADQQRLIQAVGAAGNRTVVVLLAGRPLVLDDATLEASDALLMAYLPGTAGGTAVADVLFGAINPAGRLPFSWPRSVGQLPIPYDRPPAPPGPDPQRDRPLFEFGFGLSYSRFEYGTPTVTPELAPDDAATLEVPVRNAGPAAGDEVVLVFASRDTSRLLRPARQLVAFERLTLRPGESRTVRLPVPIARLAVVPGDVLGDASAAVEPGEYTLSVGGRTARLVVR